MRYLIVNGDDFGASPGINAGILEAHRDGILTSASLMVDAPAARDAAVLGRGMPTLGLGLHVQLRGESTDGDWDDEVRRQVVRFCELTGGSPDHLDSHHDVHRAPRVLPHFLAIAREYGIPLRGHGPIRCVAKFYGQWNGETHLEQISSAGLRRLLASEVCEGVTELSCHPGYADADLRSSYRVEREAELGTLCDPAIREALCEFHIQVISFAQARTVIDACPPS
jgi:predicted glycoside hydrolase/deacetylase ChbG (UPF0249 family)